MVIEELVEETAAVQAPTECEKVKRMGLAEMLYHVLSGDARTRQQAAS